MALFREKEGELLPIAIQLKQQPSEDNPVSFKASRQIIQVSMQKLISYYLWSCYRILRSKILYLEERKTDKMVAFYCLTFKRLAKFCIG